MSAAQEFSGTERIREVRESLAAIKGKEYADKVHAAIGLLLCLVETRYAATIGAVGEAVQLADMAGPLVFSLTGQCGIAHEDILAMMKAADKDCTDYMAAHGHVR